MTAGLSARISQASDERRSAVALFFDDDEEQRQPEEILERARAQQYEGRGEDKRTGKMMDSVSQIRVCRVREAPRD